MSEFWLYFELGLTHVLDVNAYDHVLFIVALCASYGLGSWKRLLLLVSLFTIGHTTSLYLASKGFFPISSEWIELLIPITILLTALYSFWSAYKDRTIGNEKGLYVATLFFGVIHGFGFGRYYIHLNDEGALQPLISFALGIEAAQLAVVLVFLVLIYVLGKLYRLQQPQLRTMIISLLVILATIVMIVSNVLH